MEKAMKLEHIRHIVPDYLRKSALSPFVIFLTMAVPATLCAGCTMFFSSGVADPSDGGVLAIAVGVLALLNGAIWTFVKGLTKR
jgi:hypothetical protein